MCDKETLARGIHLHVQQSEGDGHGEQGTVPDGFDRSTLEPVGKREVEMNYPTTRETEEIGRMCPYCNGVFRGKHGVMIHLGKSAGKGPHPGEGESTIDPEDTPIVNIEEQVEIVDSVADGSVLPPSRNHQITSSNSALSNRIQCVIEEFRDQGKEQEATRLEEALYDR